VRGFRVRTKSSAVVGSRAVHGRTRRLAATLTVTAVAAVVVAVLPATGARSSSRADELRRADAALATRSRAAVLELYALRAAVARAQAELATARGQAAAAVAERDAVGAQVRIARRSASAAHAGLARRLRALYEQGGTDPLAIILASDSIEDAMATIDGLEFAAQQDRTLVRRTELAKAQLVRLEQRLAERATALARAERQARERAGALAARESEREAYVAALARERRLKAAAISALDRAAAAAQARSARIVATAAAPGGGVSLPEADPVADVDGEAGVSPVPAVAGRTIVVAATAYAIHGRTSTGLPTGWGVAAVDPGVIPLGTRFFVPGYGEAVAADVGPAVRGNEIDLWFPSLAQARAWGRRTVSIVIH